jgi:hypothetical protein
MDATIIYDEDVALARINILTLNPRPNFEQIRVLCHHFEHALQCLPCPQTTLYRWKGMAMAQELYALLTPMPFCLPNDPGNAAIYIRPVVAGQPINTTPLMRMEQATTNMQFARAKHYFLSMRNIERACFTALNARSMTPSRCQMTLQFKVGTPACTSLISWTSTPAILETNNAIFRSPYLAADAPEVLFHQIGECAKMVLLGCNPCTDQQLVTNAIRLLLTTGLYIRLFEEWDCLTAPNQTWIALCTMIQEAFNGIYMRWPQLLVITATPQQCRISKTL